MGSSRKPIVFMFSGQGGQYYQMGHELYQQQPTFRAWMQAGDRLAQARLGVSILAELYAAGRKKDTPFKRTRFTNPAIFLTEYSLAQTLIEHGLKADYVLGVSLGSFAALAVAGALTFAEALEAVIHQAECLEATCQPGGMLAILDSPRLFEETPWLWQQSTLAGVNFDRHFVVSTSQGNVEIIRQALKQAGVLAEPLHVSYAFHSAAIDPAEASFSEFLDGLPQRRLQLPFMCCVAASRRDNLPKNYLWTASRAPMRFRDTITTLEAQGAWTYVDVGPSGTLATFVKYNLSPQSASTPWPVMTPFGHDAANLNKLFNATITI